MPPKSVPERPAAADFSIDEFIGEIEKAEDERLNKRLPQERLKNKRALDNAARRAAEAEVTGSSEGPHGEPVEPRGPGTQKAKKATRSAATGMSLKAPKSKANSVDRPQTLPGFEEPPQAGFGHVPSGRVTARDISRAAAKDPATLQQLRTALSTATEKVEQATGHAPGQAATRSAQSNR